MKVKIIHTLHSDQSSQTLEDMLNWPDATSRDTLQPLVTQYLDNKYGTGQYTLITIEVL